MKFIVGYEETPSGVAALKLAKQHARVFHADIEVVWSITRDKPIKYTQLAEKEAYLENEIQKYFTDTKINYRVSLTTDEREAGEQIVQFARRKKGDLIYIGVKKKSRVGKMLTGSNLQYVILKATCPVVTVQPDTDD